MRINMKRYLLTSNKIRVGIVVWYDALLKGVDMLRCELSEEQIVYLFKHLPLRHSEFLDVVKNTPFTVRVLPVEATFEYFNTIYPHSRNTHLARAFWPKMSKREQLFAVVAAADYRAYCERNAWYKPMLPEKWLKSKQYINDWNSL